MSSLDIQCFNLKGVKSPLAIQVTCLPTVSAGWTFGCLAGPPGRGSISAQLLVGKKFKTALNGVVLASIHPFPPQRLLISQTANPFPPQSP